MKLPQHPACEDPQRFEVEFSDDAGRTYAAVALRAEQMMRLHHEPTHQVA